MTDLKLISLKVTFHLTDLDAFWTEMAQEAARIDEEETGEPQESYSQGQAFTVVFHRDGFETIGRLLHNHGLHPMWNVEDDWSDLAGIGSQIAVPNQEG